MSQRSALVLGAFGFIGRHLTRRLVRDGWEVSAAALADRSPRRTLPKEATTVTVAKLDSDGIGTALDAARPGVVFNLVAAGVEPNSRDPESLAAGNAGIVASLLSALQDRNGIRVIHTGSWSEYADPTSNTPISEEHPIAPSTAYGTAKAEGTLLGLRQSRGTGNPFTVLRLFHVYGPGEAPHRLLPYLVDRLTRGEPADLTAGTQIRDFVYVSDAVDALVAAATTDLETEPFNVATGIGTAVADVVRMVAAELDAPNHLLRFGALESRPDEPETVIGNAARFSTATGWSARTSVAAGVRRTIQGITSDTARQQA